MHTTIRQIERIVLALTLGLAVGLGCYTFIYARGASYLLNDPAACANCHVMNEQYDGWLKSSHRHVATCNDCHTPPGTLAKYATKATNGFWHSFYFTTGTFHEPIQIGARNRAVTESACRKCHEEITTAIDPTGASASNSAAGAHGAAQTACLHCHRSVGHLH
ncbi:MAG: cytochrome c nitrite reductase small subunit [Blastocatellia bacterium]